MLSSDSSPLSSPPASGDELDFGESGNAGIAKFFGKTGKAAPLAESTAVSPTRQIRSPSPPHEYTHSDNPDIAFIVMFMSRFHTCFPSSLHSFGPQDLERAALEPTPGEHLEKLLCALLSLVLNRKKYVERAHYQRPLEEAVHANHQQWPGSWGGKNPLHGARTFTIMDFAERLSLLRRLIFWAMASSELVLATIKESYKQARREGDLNQPLSVQAWGQDGLHRRYWLIEGRDDTDFRLYREGNVELQNPDWRAVAGDIEELKSISSKLSEDGSQAARRLSERITSALPRFEAIQEKRKRREYRQSRKAQFVRPEPGFSLYEGRTRGKKGKYVFSSEDDDEDQVKPAHRASARSRHSGSPYAAEAPVFTASGRQVKARQGGVYGESMLSGQSAPQQPGSFRESRRSGLRNRSAQGSPPAGSHIQGYNAVDEMVDDEEDAASSGADADADDYEAGNGDDEIDDDSGPDDMSDASDLDDDERPAKRARRSLIVKLLLSEKAQAIANGYFPAEVPQNEGRAMAGEPNGNLLEKNGSNDLPGPEMGGELPKQDLAEAVVLKPLPAEKALEQLNGYSVSKPGLQEVPAQLAIENNGGTPFEKIPLPTQLLEKALEPVNTDVSGLPAGDGVVDAAKPSADAASANGHHPQPEPMAS